MSHLGHLSRLFLAALLTFTAQPAAAQAKPSSPAAGTGAASVPYDPCAAAQDMSFEDIGALKRWLAMATPVSSIEIAKNLSIKRVAPDQFGPYYEPLAPGKVISVPDGFVRLHCRLVATTWALEGDFTGPRARAIAATFNRCWNDRPMPACLDLALDGEWRSVVAMLNEKTGRPQYVGHFADDALKMLLLHEYAHIAFGHTPQNGSRSRNQEFDADVYATTFGGINQLVVYSNLYNFWFLSYLVADASPSHDPNACRARDAETIAMNTSFLERAAFAVPDNEGLKIVLSPSERSLVRDTAAGKNDKLLDTRMVSNARGCPDRAFPGLTELNADLRSLLSFQEENIDQSLSGADTRVAKRFLTRLQVVPVRGVLGRYAKGHLVSMYIRTLDLANQTSDLNDDAEHYLATNGESSMISADFGRMIGDIYINKYHAGGDSLPPPETRKILHEKLSAATYYNEAFSEAYAVEALLFARERRCGSALTRARLSAKFVGEESRQSASGLVTLLQTLVQTGRCPND